MKRIIILLLLVFSIANVAYADEYSDFMRSLKLSETQEAQIAQIEKKYSYEIAQLRANIILRGMQIAKTKGKSSLENDFSSLNNEIEELQSEKEDEIASCLGLIKRFRYRRFCKKIAEKS